MKNDLEIIEELKIEGKMLEFGKFTSLDELILMFILKSAAYENKSILNFLEMSYILKVYKDLKGNIVLEYPEKAFETLQETLNF